MKSFHSPLVAGAGALVLLAASLPAQALVTIDNFASGPFNAGYVSDASGRVSVGDVETGSMAGGVRDWSVALIGPAGLGATVDISPSGFAFHSETGLGHRFDWTYGSSYVTHHAMNLDLSGEDRLHFQFAEAPLGLNFNVLLYYNGWVGNYSQLGLNIAPQTSPFGVDFRFADFATHMANSSSSADFAHVSGIYIVTQSGSSYTTGGEGFRITSISAVPEPASAAMALAGLGVLLGLRRRSQAPCRSICIAASFA
jgi:MYXO-CTERM domain-containing protein